MVKVQALIFSCDLLLWDKVLTRYLWNNNHSVSYSNDNVIRIMIYLKKKWEFNI